MITPTSSSIFEPIVNVRLLNNPLFIGVVLPMLLKYVTAELRFWFGSTGNVNVRMTSSTMSVKIFCRVNGLTI